MGRFGLNKHPADFMEDLAMRHRTLRKQSKLS